MDKKDENRRRPPIFDDSSNQPQPNHLNQHQLRDFLEDKPPAQDFNTQQDNKIEYQGYSNEQEGNKPMEAAIEYDQQRLRQSTNFKHKHELKQEEEVQSQDYQKLEGYLNRRYNSSFDQSSRRRSKITKQEREAQELRDARRFKEQTLCYFIDEKKKSKQHTLNVDGIDIHFPFKPYDIQIKYIKKVLECLNKGENGLLESPTGTGKTLCLLSGILSWMAKQKMSNCHRRLVFLSRTHSQLFQVVKEMKSTCFRPTMVHIGSRDHACIKSELKELKSREKMQACAKGVKIRKKYCKHEYDFTKMTKEEEQRIRGNMCNYYEPDRQSVIELGKKKYSNTAMDLEEMKQEGLTYHFCPYYYPFYMEQYLDVFIMPYNYILDADLLPRFGNILSGSVVVFDEAHNVSEASCEGRSAELFKVNMTGAELELSKIFFNSKKSSKLGQISSKHKGVINMLLIYLKDMEGTFNQFLKEIPFEDSPIEEDKLYMGENKDTHIKIINSKVTTQRIYELFAGKISNLQQFTKDSKKATEMMRKLYNDNFNTCSIIETLIEQLKEAEDGIFHNLQKVASFSRKALGLMMQSVTGSDWFSTQINHFRLMFQVKLSQKKTGTFEDFKIQLRCLVPWLTFDQIQKYSPRSIIFTSGTMAPLESWEVDLKIQAPVRLVNSHVISENQIRLNIVKKSKGDFPFNFAHKYMKDNSNQIYDELVLTLIDIQKKIPHGILVVCPNFKTVFQLKRLVSTSFVNRQFKKALIFQQRGNENYVEAFKLEAEQGAILVCVCRGKASEGIDFPDNHCRAVIMVGVPYPNVRDPYLIEKEEHFRRLEREGRDNPDIPKINWYSWYLNGTVRAVNQALGRVVRHFKDYGMLFLFDERYEQPKLLSKMPKWAKESLYIWSSWQERRINDVDTFYKQNKMLYPMENERMVDENEDTFKNENIAIENLLVNKFKQKKKVFVLEVKKEVLESMMEQKDQNKRTQSKPKLKAQEGEKTKSKPKLKAQEGEKTKSKSKLKVEAGQKTLFDFMKTK